MKENKDKNKMNEINGEDVTKYGEFISSFDKWLPPEKQKEKAHELENVTRVNKERGSNKTQNK